MVINREFFFRGWLPAGLLINARLITRATSSTGQAVLKPILNPLPGSGWRVDQPRPVFPVDQATNDTAIVLVDPFPDGTIALLPLGEWYGSGTPYLLGINTWYEGRIRTVSGSDVMGVRLLAGSARNYFSDNNDAVEKDVAAVRMPCHHIIGRHTEQILMIDAADATLGTLGYAPIIALGENNMQSRLINRVALSAASFAGTRTIYATSDSSADPVPFIQCEAVDGKFIGKAPDFVGIVIRLDAGDQKFFYLSDMMITGIVEDLNKSNPLIGTVAISEAADQVVHYN